MPGVTNFLGETVGEGAAFAAGLAVAPILRPLVQALENETWSQYPDRPLDPDTLAEAVAEGKVQLAPAAAEAALSGMSAARFNELVAVARVGPGIATGLNLWRRGLIGDDDFTQVLTRAGLESEWFAALIASKELPLSAQDVAVGMVRNNVQNIGSNGQPIFPPGLDSSSSTVPQAPQASFNPVAEAAKSGIDEERFRVIANNVGLPPGVIEGLSMLNRGIITEADFALLIEQSDTRIAWGPFILQLRRMLLTPHEYAELYIRGWIEKPDAYAGGELHGLEQGDMDLLIDMIGRPISTKQITTGLARGGTFGGVYEGVPEPYLSAIRQGNVRPEWGNLDYANRYTYPSYFVIKPLVADGAITVDEATQIFENEGWPPELAAKAAQSFAPAGTAAVKPKTLTAAEIRKAADKGTITPDNAQARLERLGYSTEDATIYLASA